MSPIKGLTDRGLSFPEIGQIRKGAKKTGNRPGEDLTYFRVEFDEREKKAEESFWAVYTNKETGKREPQAIRIILPFDEIERMWDAWYEGYTAGRMVARADGEIFTYLIDAKTNRILVKNGIDIETGMPRPFIEGRPVGFYTSNGKEMPIFCKPSGRLKVIIPELARAVYLTVLTTSIHDILNISDQLRAFQQINGGRLSGIPLVLRRRPKAISTPNADGTRARRVKWLLSIEADPEWVKKRLMATKAAALPGNGLALLSEPSGEYEQDAGDLSDLPTEHDEDEIEDGQYTDATPEEPPAEAKPASLPQNAASTNGGAFNPVTEFVALGLARNNFEAMGIINKYMPNDTRKAGKDAMIAWGRLYRAWRDMGSSPEAAAKNATEGVPVE